MATEYTTPDMELLQIKLQYAETYGRDMATANIEHEKTIDALVKALEMAQIAIERLREYHDAHYSKYIGGQQQVDGIIDAALRLAKGAA